MAELPVQLGPYYMHRLAGRKIGLQQIADEEIVKNYARLKGGSYFFYSEKMASAAAA